MVTVVPPLVEHRDSGVGPILRDPPRRRQPINPGSPLRQLAGRSWPELGNGLLTISGPPDFQLFHRQSSAEAITWTLRLRRCEHGGVSDLRDYDRWHHLYDDPGSGLSWRLNRVQHYITQFLDQNAGSVRVLSVCSGDGRDVLGVLAGREDASRVTVTLLELNPALAERARVTAAAVAPQTEVSVRTADAGNTDAYVGAVPADLVLLVGIMGNISDADVQALVAAPGRCAVRVPASCGPAAVTATTSTTRSGTGSPTPDSPTSTTPLSMSMVRVPHWGSFGTTVPRSSWHRAGTCSHS